MKAINLLLNKMVLLFCKPTTHRWYSKRLMMVLMFIGLQDVDPPRKEKGQKWPKLFLRQCVLFFPQHFSGKLHLGRRKKKHTKKVVVLFYNGNSPTNNALAGEPFFLFHKLELTAAKTRWRAEEKIGQYVRWQWSFSLCLHHWLLQAWVKGILGSSCQENLVTVRCNSHRNFPTAKQNLCLCTSFYLQCCNFPQKNVCAMHNTASKDIISKRRRIFWPLSLNSV